MTFIPRPIRRWTRSKCGDLLGGIFDFLFLRGKAKTSIRPERSTPTDPWAIHPNVPRSAQSRLITGRRNGCAEAGGAVFVGDLNSCVLALPLNCDVDDRAAVCFVSPIPQSDVGDLSANTAKKVSIVANPWIPFILFLFWFPFSNYPFLPKQFPFTYSFIIQSYFLSFFSGFVMVVIVISGPWTNRIRPNAQITHHFF